MSLVPKEPREQPVPSPARSPGLGLELEVRIRVVFRVRAGVCIKVSP